MKIINRRLLLLLIVSGKEKKHAWSSLEMASVTDGKTLVPFRLTGNIEWGVPAPALEGLDDLTVWVWPESLWAPISFTMAYLESQNKGWTHGKTGGVLKRRRYINSSVKITFTSMVLQKWQCSWAARGKKSFI